MLIVDRHECWTELGSLKAQIHSICLFVQLHTRLSVHGARQAPEKPTLSDVAFYIPPHWLLEAATGLSRVHVASRVYRQSQLYCGPKPGCGVS